MGKGDEVKLNKDQQDELERNKLEAAANELKANYAPVAARKKCNRGRKKLLNACREDIVQKILEGRSNQWIADWLARNKSVKVNQSTVSRFKHFILGGHHA